jgi:hypothetical protein
MTDHTIELEALDAIADEIGRGRPKQADPHAHLTADFALDPSSLCATYKTIRPKLVVVLNLIDWIPGYGKKVGDAVRFLMSVADSTCTLK